MFLVESGDVAATDVERFSWAALSRELQQAGVEILVRSKIERVASEGVLAVTVVSVDKGEQVLLADRLVVIPELKPNNGLAQELLGKVETLVVIGDAKQPRRSREAISEGYVASFNL